MKFRQPCVEQPFERAGQAAKVAEIDHVQFAPRRKVPRGVGKGAFPIGDHRQRIGQHHPVKRRLAKQRGGIKGAGIAFDQPRFVAQGRARALEHFGGNIEAVEPHPRPRLGDLVEIAPGAAGNLQHPHPRLGRQPGDQRIAPEQVIFAGQVIDVPLPAIDLVHQGGVTGRLARSGHHASS